VVSKTIPAGLTWRGLNVAIIEPEGLFTGERLAACSDLAQLYWPRFYIGSNGYARIELSYTSIISKIFSNFEKPPESKILWNVFREYEANCLAILYESNGVWWCEFATSEKYLPRYKTRRDEQSPSPTLEMRDNFQKQYILWKSSKSICSQSFQKLSEDFVRRGVGVGVGGGVGDGDGEETLSSPSAHRDKSREKEIVESIFGFYCEKLGKNPKRYQLTDERRKKAGLRFRERLKANDGNEAAVEVEFSQAVENLAASEYHISNDFVDWIAQIFKSQEEFEKRLNWKQHGGNGNGKAAGNGKSILDDLQELEEQNRKDRDGGKPAQADEREAGESSGRQKLGASSPGLW
jgi:hypothetical protein